MKPFVVLYGPVWATHYACYTCYAESAQRRAFLRAARLTGWFSNESPLGIATASSDCKGAFSALSASCAGLHHDALASTAHALDEVVGTLFRQGLEQRRVDYNLPHRSESSDGRSPLFSTRTMHRSPSSASTSWRQACRTVS